MSRRAFVLMVAVLVVLAVGLSYFRVLARRVFFEIRPNEEPGVKARLTEAAMQSAGGATRTVTLYFPSLNEGKLRGEARDIALAETNGDRIREILLALTAGSRLGHDRALPASAEVRAVFLTPDGTAYL